MITAEPFGGGFGWWQGASTALPVAVVRRMRWLVKCPARDAKLPSFSDMLIQLGLCWRIQPAKQPLPGRKIMQHETVTYEADGLVMKSQLFFEPGAGKRAGVLVFPEIFGLSPHAVQRAERLVKEGYVALACDIHGEGKLLADLQQAIGLMGPLYADTKRMRARGLPALAALAKRAEVDAGKLAAIGFCFGGTLALELARGGAEIKAAVGFHSGLATTSPQSAVGSIKARVLACIGADDPFISPEERAKFEAEMRAAGADWQMHLYGNTVHSFTTQEAAARNNPGAMRYSPESDRRSWAAMHQLFSETLAQ
jgi:dienelactone hydrolase